MRIKDILPETEILALLAEEAAELAQAALKLRRVLDGTNPTPVTEGAARNDLVEEYGDVLNCADQLFSALDLALCTDMRDKKKQRWVTRLEERRKMKQSEYSEEFDKLRRVRTEMAFFKYGPALKNFGEGRVDALATAELCLDAFKRDGNTEHLIDAANYLMFRFMYPLPGDYFQATDSSGSVGTVGTPINMERGDFG